VTLAPERRAEVVGVFRRLGGAGLPVLADYAAAIEAGVIVDEQRLFEVAYHLGQAESEASLQLLLASVDLSGVDGV